LPFFYQPTAAAAIWLHAVSVGEVLSAVSLVAALRELYAKAPVFVSCTTVAGREVAEKKLAGIVDGIFYAPLDYRRCVRRVLRTLRPALVVILETEIWPNLYREAKRSSAALVIVNGRISDRAATRYRRLRWFFRAVLAEPDEILVQSEQDRERYIAAGAPPERVRTAGNLKYDFNSGDGRIAPEIHDLLRRSAPERIWIAASTMPPAGNDDIDEDDVVIDAFQRIVCARMLLILAPRRPERFDQAAAKLDRAGVPFVRRSQLEAVTQIALPGVLLLDTVGELSPLFALADLVFMGGTLARRGGHNILEPAAFGCCIITGPRMENFAAIASEFTAANATVSIGSPAELAPVAQTLLEDTARAREIGGRSRAIAESKRGITARTAGELLQWYRGAIPCDPGSALLEPLSRLWAFGVRRDRAHSLARKRRLATPVVSIGNITMGGSGKTPFVAWLAAQLRERGTAVAILTRGYRRRSTEDALVLPPGESCPVFRTGDEPQLLLRSGFAYIGIGADRLATGKTIERHFAPGIFLLDDGFQHWRLHRDLDIVLIDALNPFGCGHVFPRGRLREPLDGLSRAGAFVITRTEAGVSTCAIERVLRRYNPAAPIFRARIRPDHWIRLPGQHVGLAEAPFRRVAAFCGLGNPESFWTTLHELELDVVFRWHFGDHHSYRTFELRRFVLRAFEAGADAVVTTEKDAVNLPDNAAELTLPLPLFSLKIGIEVDGAERLLEIVR
jgi:3-deoxy-D-manno-octulosonic-acid transferase